MYHWCGSSANFQLLFYDFMLISSDVPKLCLSVGILTPSDEFQYWTDLSNTGSKLDIKERALFFCDLFQQISKVKQYSYVTKGKTTSANICCLAHKIIGRGRITL